MVQNFVFLYYYDAFAGSRSTGNRPEIRIFVAPDAQIVNMWLCFNTQICDKMQACVRILLTFSRM
jgi:hypothetical protein